MKIIQTTALFSNLQDCTRFFTTAPLFTELGSGTSYFTDIVYLLPEIQLGRDTTTIPQEGYTCHLDHLCLHPTEYMGNTIFR